MSNFLKILSLAVALMCGGSVSAQDWSREVDSLDRIAQLSTDSIKARIFNDIAWKLRSIHPEISVQYCMKAIEIGNRTNDYYVLIKGYSYIGVCHRNLGNKADALEFYKLELETAVSHNDTVEIAYANNNLANMYERTDYDKCVEYAERALDLATQIHDTSVIAYSAINLGRANTYFRNFDNAKYYLDMAYRLRVESHQPILVTLTSKRTIGDLYKAMGKYDSAMVIYKECMSYDNMAYTTMYTSLASNISDIYRYKGMYDSAFFYGIRARDFLRTSKKFDRTQVYGAYNTLALDYIAIGDYESASRIYQEELRAIDSMYSMEVQGRFFTFEYSASQYKQQMRIEQLAHNQHSQHITIIYLSIGLALGILVAVWLFSLYKKLKAQKKQISKSIAYAHKIQAAIFPDFGQVGGSFSSKFLLFRPRDEVSGDFYWHYDTEAYEIIAVGDCTGHGVPGAFMSMLGTSSLHDIASRNISSASEILELLRRNIKTVLHQKSISDNQDGMDIAVVVVDRKTMVIDYSGAYIPLYYIRDNEIHTIEPTRNPIGIYVCETKFESHYLQLQSGDQLYLSSDGYRSQLRGTENMQIGTPGYKDLLLKYHNFPMAIQREMLGKYIDEWRGARQQTDDILVMGLKV